MSQHARNITRLSIAAPPTAPPITAPLGKVCRLVSAVEELVGFSVTAGVEGGCDTNPVAARGAFVDEVANVADEIVIVKVFPDTSSELDASRVGAAAVLPKACVSP